MDSVGDCVESVEGSDGEELERVMLERCQRRRTEEGLGLDFTLGELELNGKCVVCYQLTGEGEPSASHAVAARLQVDDDVEMLG